MKIETALLSVSDKTGIVEFARGLSEMGVTILSTGGTARTLREADVPVVKVSDYTGFPEILEGRVKTLHPKIHGGILARHDQREHQRTLQQHDMVRIGLVAVNLYPFSKTVARPGVTLQEAIEQIDIGGPTMVRAAAKNSAHVTIVVDPSDYASVIAEMQAHQGKTRDETRRKLGQKAFRHTAAYDSAISEYFDNLEAAEDELPSAVGFNLIRVNSLRYGENPHQRAALYRSRFEPVSGLVKAHQHQGKELSFNNYVDLEAAWALCSEFEEPFCGILKHTNPCGAAIGDDPAEAYEKALATDPVSAFGSVIGFNRFVDAETAEKVASLFVEAIIAPGYQPDALRILSGKKNVRLMELQPGDVPGQSLDYKKILGGFLVQDKDVYFTRKGDLKVVTQRKPTVEQVQDLLFAWSVCKHVKSNAILFARGGQTLGVGAGQMSRVDSVILATRKAQLPTIGAVMASDAFFPFRDGIDEAARAGIKAIIQPGGSMRDQESITAADEHGIAMVFTGVRHFKH